MSRSGATVLILACALIFGLAGLILGVALQSGRSYLVLGEAFLDRWQTLVAAAVVIIAALIAARPIRDQLRVMAVQSAVSSRAVLLDRLVKAEARLDETHDRVARILADLRFMVAQQDKEDEGEEDVGAFALTMHEGGYGGTVAAALVALNAQARNRADTPEQTALRRKAIQAVTVVSGYLSELDEYRSGPAGNETAVAARHARNQLLLAISTAQDAVASLIGAYEREIYALGARIREIDALILQDAAG